MSSSVPYDPYIPNQTTGEQSASRTAAIQAVSNKIKKGLSTWCQIAQTTYETHKQTIGAYGSDQRRLEGPNE